MSSVRGFDERDSVRAGISSRGARSLLGDRPRSCESPPRRGDSVSRAKSTGSTVRGEGDETGSDSCSAGSPHMLGFGFLLPVDVPRGLAVGDCTWAESLDMGSDSAG